MLIDAISIKQNKSRHYPGQQGLLGHPEPVLLKKDRCYVQPHVKWQQNYCKIIIDSRSQLKVHQLVHRPGHPAQGTLKAEDKVVDTDGVFSIKQSVVGQKVNRCQQK